MIEGRWKIKNLNEIKSKIILKGIKKGEYSSKDIIFTQNNKENLKEGFIRLRIYKKNNWNTKNIVLTHKETTWENNYKKDKIILKKEFDNEKETSIFLDYNYKNIKEFVNFYREGEEFELNNNKIYLENIEHLGFSIEIESKDEENLNEIVKYLEIEEKLTDSIPETIRKLKCLKH